MTSVGLLPAVALITGAACGTFLDVRWAWTSWLLPPLACVSAWAWWVGACRVVIALLTAGFLIAGVALASDARVNALHPSLRSTLDAAFGGFAIEDLGPGGAHTPVGFRAVLVEDAAVYEDYVSLRTTAVAARLDGVWRPVDGGVTVSVGGSSAATRAQEWRAGRHIEVPVVFRRPARFLNDGVPDFERDLVLDGTSLLASAKSGLLVDVIARGSPLAEAAAEVRAHVRRAVAMWVAPHDRVSGAIVLAVLIGDRTGLPDTVRERLQAAGTYHVIAISGGNIAILTALVVGLLRLFAFRGRGASLVAIAALLLYAQVATTGPSVWRATLMAVLYLAARSVDHRSPPWHAVAVAAALMIVVRPLDIRDPGFVLTFGATAALLEGARHAPFPRRRGGWFRAAAWAAASLGGSLAVELTLVPVSASVFSRITVAGLVLNLVAVPMMAVAQTAGIVTTLAGPVESVAAVAGWIAHLAAASIVGSSGLVEAAPWLALRVPPPGVTLVLAYYLALGGLALRGRAAVMLPRGARAAAGVVLGVSLLLMVLGVGPALGESSARPAPGTLRWTMFDVGQGEAMLFELPDGRTILIDSGGAPFGGAAIDIGARVLGPALWARGVRVLDTLLVTHGDPDHIGGVRSVLRDLDPVRLWHGVPVPTHVPMQELLGVARDRRVAVEERRAGQSWTRGGARIRVLHPPEPDWERRRVRNDDSVVLEIVYGDVAMLLTGDISGEIERTLVARLTPSRTRILKVAHHGSRTSTSAALVDGWRPHLALISSGRGNTFGHPAPEVIRRLESVGARVLRTDLDGEITIETDGRTLRVGTYRERAIGEGGGAGG